MGKDGLESIIFQDE